MIKYYEDRKKKEGIIKIARNLFKNPKMRIHLNDKSRSHTVSPMGSYETTPKSRLYFILKYSYILISNQ